MPNMFIYIHYIKFHVLTSGPYIIYLTSSILYMMHLYYVLATLFDIKKTYAKYDIICIICITYFLKICSGKYICYILIFKF